jgi:hypothetical protein
MRIGKTRIELTARGCIDCGTEYATGWSTERTFVWTFGEHKQTVSIPICATCAARRSHHRYARDLAESLGPIDENLW